MYGMINRAIKGYYVHTYGDDLWNKAKAKAGLDLQDFVTLDQYPDEVSVSLVVAGAELLKREVADVLEDIGVYFVNFAVENGYRPFVQNLGREVPEILSGLDNMHARLSLSFPELNAPSFWCADIEQERLVLNYQSTREGLSPLVVGLVKGLAQELKLRLSIAEIEPVSNLHRRFEVRFERAQ